MNWTRGLFRLWIFASLAFSVLVGSMVAGPTVGVWHFLLLTAILSAAVSIPTLIIGAGLVWVVRGFLQKAPQP